MKMISNIYTVELTPADIEYITTALQGEYNFIREEDRDGWNSARIARRDIDLSAVRALRNSFGDLIGVRYMGADA